MARLLGLPFLPPYGKVMPCPMPVNGHLNHSNAYQNALELQRLLLGASKDPTIKPVTLAALSRAFCELEETKRKLKMRPLPKAIDVTPKGRGKPKDSGLSLNGTDR